VASRRCLLADTSENGQFKNLDVIATHGAHHWRDTGNISQPMIADIHTQTIEGLWSTVKHGISGSNHAVSKKWLQGYLNEYVWRYNHRDDPRSMFELLLLRSVYPAET
jgi:hypothetical protein